jgi:protein SCO1
MKRFILTVILGLATAIAVWYGLNPAEEHIPVSTSLPALATATVFQSPQPLAIFRLTDSNQHAFNQNDLSGRWTLLYFGYGQCPEVCPRSLAIASDLWRKLPKTLTQEKLKFVFVSLDPKTDTPDYLRTFLNRFNPNFIGLTGDETEISRLAKSCRVYSFEDPNTPNADTHSGTRSQKIIDHTAAFMLINPEGRLHALFSPPHSSEEIALDLQKILGS